MCKKSLRFGLLLLLSVFLLSVFVGADRAGAFSVDAKRIYFNDTSGTTDYDFSHGTQGSPTLINFYLPDHQTGPNSYEFGVPPWVIGIDMTLGLNTTLSTGTLTTTTNGFVSLMPTSPRMRNTSWTYQANFTKFNADLNTYGSYDYCIGMERNDNLNPVRPEVCAMWVSNPYYGQGDSGKVLFVQGWVFSATTGMDLYATDRVNLGSVAGGLNPATMTLNLDIEASGNTMTFKYNLNGAGWQTLGSQAFPGTTFYGMSDDGQGNEGLFPTVWMGREEAYRFSGEVKDAETNEPLEGTQVIAADYPDYTMVFTGTTNSSGHFDIFFPGPGTYVITECVKLGYDILTPPRYPYELTVFEPTHVYTDTFLMKTSAISTTMTLYQGWNLISLPSQPQDTAVGSVLAAIDGFYAIVWKFINTGTSTSWVFYDPGDPEGSLLTTMEAGYGYWIYMTQTKTLHLLGQQASKTMSLPAGWNLVGYNSPTSGSAGTVLASINGKYAIVWKFINNGTTTSWVFYDPGDPEGSLLTTFDPHYGFWFYMTELGTWTLP
jgi:hypothetical protein